MYMSEELFQEYCALNIGKPWDNEDYKRWLKYKNIVENMCLHCLEEGYWIDEDKCPNCATKGHVSPWEVSQCPACNKEYRDKMDSLLDRIHGGPGSTKNKRYQEYLRLKKEFEPTQTVILKENNYLGPIGL